MYFITVMEKIEPNIQFYADFGDIRCIGYYKDLSRAYKVLRNNLTNIWEGCYNYAVIEKIEEGISGSVVYRQFFYYNNLIDGYEELEEPNCVNCLTNLGLG